MRKNLRKMTIDELITRLQEDLAEIKEIRELLQEVSTPLAQASSLLVGGAAPTVGVSRVPLENPYSSLSEVSTGNKDRTLDFTAATPVSLEG
jgi:hypothetical protein